MDTRLFYVVDSVEANEEIFNTWEKARVWMRKLENDGDENVRLRICEVNHAYYDEHAGGWNYDDYSDTFTTIKEFKFEEQV